MSDATLPLAALAVGTATLAVGGLLVRASGADIRSGRRLAGAPAHSLAGLQERAAENRLPTTAVRIGGRVRCATPIVTPDGDRLAAIHRDVEVRLPDGRWRLIERLRETRPIDLWERTTSVALNLSELAAPLITIPEVWQGAPAELGPSYRPAIDRLTAEVGPPDAARSVTRRLTLVDQLQVLAVPVRGSDGRLELRPPPGGFLVSAVEMDTAMRLLAGGHRSQMVAGLGLVALGAISVAAGLVALLVDLAG